MAYIKVDGDNKIIFINNQDLTDLSAIEQLTSNGCFHVEGVINYSNQDNIPSNKAEVLYWDFEKQETFSEFVDIPLTPEQRIEQLERQLVEQQEQFRLELAESNTQMFEMMMTMQMGGLE